MNNDISFNDKIEKEMQQRKHFFWNWLTWALIHYIVINLFLVGINWITSPHYWWVLWVIVGWGISLLMEAIEKSIKY